MNLHEYLKSIKSMSDAKADMIAGYFKEEVLPQKDLIIHEGMISKKSYFLQAGIVRCYIIDLNGDEITTRFYSDPDFLNDFLSFFEQKPSEEYYELVTDCTLFSISYDNVQHCFHNIPEFREWGRMMLTLNYSYLNKRMISFHKETAQERYMNLIKKHPEILEKAPLNTIASYLGITKFSLSRIRKEVAELS